MYLKGFWLILIESDGSELAVASQILSNDGTHLRLQAHIPPAWYPQTFTGYKVRHDGTILGWRRLSPGEAIQIPTHAGLHSIELELALTRPQPTDGGRQAMIVSGD